MRNDKVTSTIEEYFAKNYGDGEFSVQTRRGSMDRGAHSRRGLPSIYCPKRRSLPREFRSSAFWIGRPGLPNPDDNAWLKRRMRGRRVRFLGDLDPVDLLIFAWLRAQCPTTRLEHVGINDSLLAAVGFELTPVPDNFTIRLRGSEKKAIAVLTESFPDYALIVGENCASLLARGRKLELEALISREPDTRPALLSALLRE